MFLVLCPLVPCCGAEEGLEANLEDCRTTRTFRSLRRGGRRGRRSPPWTGSGRETPVASNGSSPASRGSGNSCWRPSTGPLAEVLVFADSDGRPSGRPGRLVAELEDPGVGVASSIRSTGRFRRRSPRFCGEPVGPGVSSWGTTTATSRGVAPWPSGARCSNRRRAGGAGPSHDYAITHAVRRGGLRVGFVLGCVVGSEGRVGFASMLSWSPARSASPGVYWPLLFWLAAAAA